MKCEEREVIRKDSRAQTLYEKVGFRVVGVHPDAFVPLMFLRLLPTA